MTFDKLFDSLQIGDKITLPNRLVMAPMTTTSGNEDGSFSDQEISYLAARAKGGIGTIISPACYVHKSGHAFPRQVGADNESLIPSLSKCAEAINSAGGKSILQIHHGGNAAQSKLSGRTPQAPSAVKNRRGTSEMPEAMTKEQIREIIESFSSAACRAKKAGFDGIEIHGANTYLLQQFFSPFSNMREDEYGVQNRENQCRFAIEAVKAIRAEVGTDYPIFYRISPEEPNPDGYDTSDAIELLKRIIPHGIDVVHVSSWEYGKGLLPFPKPDLHPTTMMQRALGVPVIGVGQIKTPEQAMRVIDDGVDMAALGRVLLFDAEWANKVKSGNEKDVRQGVSSLEEIDRLHVPDNMKAYLRKFYPDNI